MYLLHGSEGRRHCSMFQHRSQAVCCSDGQHCCPDGYACDLKSGMCTKGFIHLTSRERKTEDVSAEMNSETSVAKVHCPGGEVTCPDQNTCCPNTTGGYGCCPMPQGVCCKDHQHCCPQGYVCDTKPGICHYSGPSDVTSQFIKQLTSKIGTPLQ